MFHGAHILIVEDSPVQATVLRRALAARGYRVEWARHGGEALEKAAGSPPDLVVADIEMPVMDGYELCSRLKADERLREVPVILLTNLADPEDIIRGLNAGADNYVTKPYDEESLARRIQDLLAPAGGDGAEGLTVRLGGREHTVRSGRQQVLNLLISTFENAVEQNRELLRVNRELTRAQQALAERNRALEVLNEQKNELLGMAAHDLRNPLGVVMGFARFLLWEDDPLTDDQRMYVQNIHKSAEFLLHLVEDLLDVSALESGKLKLHLARVDLTHLVDQSLRLNTPLAAAKEIRLVPRLPDAPLELVADGRKVEQVLNNLITNALKYSHGGTEVKVSLLSPGAEAVLSVADQGQGIPREELPRLFKPFGRTSVTATAGERSTGLGLAIVRNIVEAHGGVIGVESQVGHGSTFTVRLPLEVGGVG